jgi:hypothetical protein
MSHDQRQEPGVVFGGERTRIDQFGVDGLFQLRFRVVDVSDSTSHAGAEVEPRRAEHRDDTAGHVFAAMVTRAFDDCTRAAVAHGEPFTRHAVKVGFPLRRAIK